MERDNEQHDDLIDLGSVTSETKGLPGNDDFDVGNIRKMAGSGLSND